MANTIIQIKRSTITATPTGGTLSAGELAHSYSSNVTFIGTSDGSGVEPIGGKYYVDRTNSAIVIAQAAFETANAAGTNEVVQAAFAKANSANYFAFLVNANTVAAFDKANSAQTIAVAAYDNSNTKLSSSGGTITGNLDVVGDLNVSGNTYYISVENYRVDDPLIYLAGNNYTSDIVDIGFIANYVNATGQNVHTGLFREHSNKEYYLFYGYDKEPDENHIDPGGNNFTIAVLNADIKTSNLVLGGTNAISWITSAYNQANTSGTIGSAAFDKANTAETIGVAAFGRGNTAQTIAVAAFSQANTAAQSVNLANATGTLAIARGGTNQTSFTNGQMIVFNGTSLVSRANGGSAGTFGNTSHIPVFTTDAYGFVTSVTNTSIAISAAQITSGTLPVSRGGTGNTTFTSKGVVYGNGTGAMLVTAAGTEGKVLQADGTGTPIFSDLDGGVF